MLKVGNPFLGITSKHRKKKGLPDRFLHCKLPLNKKMPDLEVAGAFRCYFSQKAKSVRKGDAAT